MAQNLTLTLSDHLEEFVQSQVHSGRSSGPQEYLRVLIEEDLRRKERERIDQLLLEGLDSGPGEVMTPERWSAWRSEIERQIEQARVENHS